jgi:hypothetical protein
MSNIRPINPSQNNIVPAAGAGSAVVVDHWAQVIATAQPAFDAIVKLRPARDWLEDRRKHYREVLIDLDRFNGDDARERLAVIPETAVLQEVAQLFDEAVRLSAPEPWFHLAIGAMLRGMPNAKGIAPDYSCIIVDMLLNDHETQERGCDPGFSAPIFISALRKVRRETEFVPSAAEILKACKEYRKRFRELGHEVEVLIEVRENAEKALRIEEHCRKLRERYGWPEDDSDVPF